MFHLDEIRQMVLELGHEVMRPYFNAYVTGELSTKLGMLENSSSISYSELNLVLVTSQFLSV